MNSLLPCRTIATRSMTATALEEYWAGQNLAGRHPFLHSAQALLADARSRHAHRQNARHQRARHVAQTRRPIGRAKAAQQLGSRSNANAQSSQEYLECSSEKADSWAHSQEPRSAGTPRGSPNTPSISAFRRTKRSRAEAGHRARGSGAQQYGNKAPNCAVNPNRVVYSVKAPGPRSLRTRRGASRHSIQFTGFSAG